MRVLIVATAAMVVMVVTVVVLGMVVGTDVKEREVMCKSYLVGDIVGGRPVELADIVHGLPGPVEA